jgi:hypothetical protein
MHEDHVDEDVIEVSDTNPSRCTPETRALIRMVRVADTNRCRTVITSITSWTDGCITHMMAIAMTTGR